MNYKLDYLSIRDQVLSLGGYVADHTLVGYAHRNKEFIFIKPTLSWKYKLFVLAHECGHLYLVKNGCLFNSLQIASEKRAHNRARQILDAIDEDLVSEYVSYWNSQLDLK